MNLSFRQLKAFLAVARLRNFTRAAEQLHMTQQGLSLLIQEMERQLGSRLFDRTTRTLALAPAGRQLLGTAEEVVRRLQDTAASIEQMSRQSARTLAIAVTPLIAAHIMPAACRQLADQHPDLRVHVIDTDRARIPELVESGEADFGLGVFFKPISGIQRRRIFDCELLYLQPSTAQYPAVYPGASANPHAATDFDGATHDSLLVRASLASPDAASNSLQWCDLPPQSLITLPADNPLQQWIDSHLARVPGLGHDRASYQHLPTILAMVEQGFGAAILPSFALAAAHHMAISAHRLHNPVVPLHFYQLRAQGRSRHPGEDIFLQALLAVMQERCAPYGATKIS